MSEINQALTSISRELAGARRRLRSGETIDLENIAQRLRQLFSSQDAESLRPFEADMVVLISECDDLIRCLQQEQAKLAAQMKSERARRDGFSAYGKPANGN